MRTCDHCGADISSRRAEAKYCTRTCANRAGAEYTCKITRKPCAWCQKFFTPWRIEQRCCSRTCGNKWSMMRRPEGYYQKIGKLGGKASKVARDYRWMDKIKDMTPLEAARRAFKMGYQAGHDKARRSNASLRRKREQAA